VADATLRFDRIASQWEYLTGDFSAWATEQEATPLLRIGRDADGRAVGFIFDFDRDDAAFSDSLAAIARDFGDDISIRVANEPTTDTEVVVPDIGALATKESTEADAMRVSRRLHRAASDIAISDDDVAGVVSVTMTVPWWARFTKPWVAVRRRGKRDILLTGPLRVRGRTARATLRYGMPYSGSALTADVVKGPRGRGWTGFIAIALAASVLALGFVRSNDDRAANPVVSQSTSDVSVSTAAPSTTSPPSASTTTAESGSSTTTTSSPTTTTTTTTTVPSTTAPTRGVIEVQPSRECQGRFCVLGVVFGRGPGCMQAGDTFTQFGDGFWPEYGLPYVYFIPGIVQPPLPGGAVLRVPVTVVSLTELRGTVPQAAEFPVPPAPGDMVSIVVSNGAYGASVWGSTWFRWCG